MRGKRAAALVRRAGAGITPADAGKTPACPCGLAAAEDHPRGCGENRRNAKSICASLGSPPRMRGKPFADAFCEPIYGITPADAGKTPPRCKLLQHYRDHPRGCGENYRPVRIQRRCRGSPPRMRGKPASGLHKAKEDRITPADAGKTAICLLTRIRPRDHPRGCGENGVTHLKLFTSLGSPPRMRGKH